MNKQVNVPAIRFEAKLFKIGSLTILRLPQSASAKLSSRGMTMVKGIINGYHFQIPLEPDGRGSHWFKVDETMSKAAHAKAGDTASLEIESIKEWPEPKLPQDLKEALSNDQKAQALWVAITPMA